MCCACTRPCLQQVVFDGRRSQELNICGEKVSEALLSSSVRIAAEAALPGGTLSLKVGWL